MSLFTEAKGSAVRIASKIRHFPNAARGQESPLLAIYSVRRDWGGLGWISNEWYGDFNRKYVNLFKSNF